MSSPATVSPADLRGETFRVAPLGGWPPERGASHFFSTADSTESAGDLAVVTSATEEGLTFRYPGGDEEALTLTWAAFLDLHQISDAVRHISPRLLAWLERP